MNINRKIEQLNESVKEVNETIDGFLLTENIFLKRFGAWLLRKKVLGKGDESEKEENIDDYKEKLKKWSEIENKESDINDIVDDAQQLLGITDDQEQELRDLLGDISKMQKEILQSAMNSKGLDSLTIKFSKPIEFKVKRGKSEGKELKLENIKTYDVFKVDKKLNTYKVYFLYKGWLKDYGIMFSVKLKDIKRGKYSNSTVNIVYVNIDSKNIHHSDIVDEKPLTHKANVEITTLK